MNGQYVNESEAKLSIYDSALMFGDMVFEMTRSFNGKQFKLEEHFERLFYGLKILRIEIPYSKKELMNVCEEIQSINSSKFKPDDEHRLLIDVSRGLLGIYQGVVNVNSGPNVIIADFPLRWTVRGMSNLFKSGINAVITSQRAIPAQYLDPKIKNRSRLFYLNANIEASLFEGENNWALLLDPDGFIAEGTGDNFFIIKNGTLITPEGRNILRGISREYVMKELAKDLSMNVIEKNIDPYDVYTADEAFMTGTPFCALPVTSLNSVPIGDGRVGNVFKRILTLWSQNVGVDIEDQIIRWDKEQHDTIQGPTPYSFKSKISKK
jgi:branched-chain amino acid aminotransferase